MLFSTDYPHWTSTIPKYALKVKMTDAQKAMMMRTNARACIGFHERHVSRRSTRSTGQSKLVTFKGPDRPVHVQGRFYGLANRCPHAGGALCEGAIVGSCKRCPGKYKIGARRRIYTHTGNSRSPPGNPGAIRKPQNQTVPIAVEPGGELGERPHVAETFPVAVEQQYLVSRSDLTPRTARRRSGSPRSASVCFVA